METKRAAQVASRDAFYDKEAIWRWATATPKGITVDLDTHTAHGLDLSPFRVCRKFRDYCLGSSEPLQAIQKYVPVTVEMTSTTEETDFEDFSQFNTIFFTKNADLVENIVRRKFDTATATGPAILLDFVLSESHTLSDLRINIKGLMRLLSHSYLTKSEKQTAVRFRLKE
jgi:hypothetical protein